MNQLGNRTVSTAAVVCFIRESVMKWWPHLCRKWDPCNATDVAVENKWQCLLPWSVHESYFQVVRRGWISTCPTSPTPRHSLMPSGISRTAMVARTLPRRCDWPGRRYSTRPTGTEQMCLTSSFSSQMVSRVTKPHYSAKCAEYEISVSRLSALALPVRWVCIQVYMYMNVIIIIKVFFIYFS